MDTAQGKKGRICQKCRMLLDTEFELVDGQPACETCAPGLKAELRRQQTAGMKLPGGWWTRSVLFGGGAALASAFIYAMIILATGFEPTFLALAVGAAIGVASRAGAGHKGGTPLQAASIVLVYLSMVLAYMVVALYASAAGNLGGLAGEITEFRTQFGDGFGVFAFAVSRPFMSGPIGLISLVLGLFAAWQFCSEGQVGASAQGILQRLANSSKD